MRSAGEIQKRGKKADIQEQHRLNEPSLGPDPFQHPDQDGVGGCRDQDNRGDHPEWQPQVQDRNGNKSGGNLSDYRNPAQPRQRRQHDLRLVYRREKEID